MRGFGLIVVCLAVVLGVYALVIFDPTVSTGYGSVYNMGKLQHRQNLLIVAGLGILVGTLLLIFGGPRQPTTAQEQFAAALEQADLPAMRHMLENGSIDPNGRAPGNMHSWLRFAVNRGAIPQCELLLKKGADPAAPDGFPRTLLDYVKDPMNNSGQMVEIRAMFEHPPERDAPSPKQAMPAASAATSLAQELAELGRLRESGLLSEEEYERAKARVLA